MQVRVLSLNGVSIKLIAYTVYVNVLNVSLMKYLFNMLNGFKQKLNINGSFGKDHLHG